MLLYYADTLGMLLMCDFPNFGEGGDTETGRRRYEETMRGSDRARLQSSVDRRVVSV